MLKLCMVLGTICTLFFGCDQKGFRGIGLSRLEKDSLNSNFAGVRLPFLVGDKENGELQLVSKLKEAFEDISGVASVKSAREASEQAGVEAVSGLEKRSVDFEQEVPTLVRGYEENYRNSIDFETDIWNEITLQRKPGTIKEALEQCKELMKYFDSGKINFDENRVLALNLFGLPKLIFVEVLPSIESRFTLKHSIEYACRAVWYRENAVYALLLGAEQIADTYQKSGYFYDLFWRRSFEILIDRVAEMMVGFDEYFDLVQGDDQLSHNRRYILENITNFRSIFYLIRELKEYFQKLRKVADCIFDNILNVVLDNGVLGGVEAEDFYKVFDRMNKDPGIQKAIDIVVEAKKKAIFHFDVIFSDYRLKRLSKAHHKVYW
ncbi:hypothetical protein [Borrelia persica]|uniref:hypothetical protein n=1 Tax=Borrelia persica TaxID=44448 RepID=UPI0004653AC2|nr:hypothetical protein [Borrelia persica]